MEEIKSSKRIIIGKPEEFKNLCNKFPPEYYRELNRKYFKEVPEELIQKYLEFIGKDWIDFFSLFSNPLMYMPPYSKNLKDYCAKKVCEFYSGLSNFNEDFATMFGFKNPEEYEIGIDIATTPKETIYSSPLLQLHRYGSFSKEKKTPILFVYSYINGYYILDLAPGKSLVEHFTNNGFDVFITDWQKPKGEMRQATLEDYLIEIDNAIDIILKLTCFKQIGALGYCIGGTLLDMMVALRQNKFKFLINLTTGIDTQVGEDGTGPFGAFTDFDIIDIKNFLFLNNNVFPGYMMNFFFDAVKPSKKAEQIYYSYIRGRKQESDPVLFWNIESSRDVAGPAHYKFLEEVYNKNSLANGEMKILGERINLKNIKMPYFNVVAQYDHIVPMPMGLQNSFLVGTPFDLQRTILVKGGHVRGVVNPELFSILSFFAEKCASDKFNL